MSPRLPFLFLAAVLGGGVVAASAEGARPVLLTTPPPVAGVAAPVASAADASASTWYCAGGTATERGFADHHVVVVNPTDDEADGYVTVFPGRLDTDPMPAGRTDGRADREPTGRGFTVAARGRASIRLADLRSASLASALVELDRGGMVVEHQVVGPHGRDVAPCASGAASDWHFAWGSTARDARELLVLFNPFASSVTIDAAFATEAGVREPLRWQGLTVPAHGVLGVDVGRDVTRRGQVAATIRARGGGRLVVDRLQVFDGSAGRDGLSLALGQPDGVEMSVFAHGLVDDRTAEQIVVYNPGRETAEVEVVVRATGAERLAPQPFGVVVRPGRFEVVDYTEEDRVPRGVEHTTVVRSRNGVPFVAERALSARGDLSTTPGALFGATTWVAAVADRGSGAATRLVVANLDPDHAVEVSVAVYADGDRLRPTDLQQLEVPAAARLVVSLSGRGEMAARPSPPGSGSGGQGSQDGLAAVVVAEGPVVVERVIARDDTVIAAGPATPAAEGLEPLP